MEKINFENKPSTNTPINATNLNSLQDNVEIAISENTELINKLIEIGNNSNGSWIKYSNGVMICYGTYVTTITTSSNPNVYYTSSTDGFPEITYPQTFVAVKSVNATVLGVNWCSLYRSYTNRCQLVIYSVAKRDGDSVTINYEVIGTWK